MLLTTKGRYAVMAMVDLALHSKQLPVKLSSIATRQGIDTAYLEQIFAKLKREGLIKATKGPGGGYTLAKSKGDILISEIMIAVEEKTKMTRCNKDRKGCMVDSSICLTHDLWVSLEKHIEGFFSSITLKDIETNSLICNNNYAAKYIF